MKKSFTLTEDWLAFIMGFVLILVANAGIVFTTPKFGWTSATELKSIFETAQLTGIFWVLIILILVGLTTMTLGGRKAGRIAVGVTFIFLISIIAQILAGYKPFHQVGLEYVIFALILGIIIRGVIGTPQWLADCLQSEFFIKTGLVLLGTTIIFDNIISAGSLGLIQSIIVVLTVWYATYWIAKRFKIDDELGIMISSAVSICGVSAAIATCGAIQGDSKKLSYVVSLVLIVALPMMIVMPVAARMVGMDPAVAGAWIGGTIDTTGAVVATGAQLGEVALNVSTIVKLSQNVLLGIAAVAISFFWMMRSKNGEQTKPDWKLIWERFPKFVLGFLGASLLYSFVLSEASVAQSKELIKSLQTALFALAFVSIGLETDISFLVKTGNGRPALVFVLAQAFNVFFTLIIAYLLFS